jgi:3-deoxy-D-manno-octulosonic-acid transferase
MYRLYGALLALAWSAVLPLQMMMSFLKRTPRPSLRERLGYLPATVSGGGFWIHAVSVGEVRLALRILPELRRRFAGAPVHLTTGTATGRALGEAGTGDQRPESVGALPFDLPFAMSRLLERLRPRAVLIVETEIWPNLLRICSERNVPVLLVNGRISERSFPRYLAVRRFLRHALEGFRSLGMQSRDDADRVIRLGAPVDRVLVTGNLKFDLEPPRVDAAGVRRRLGVAETVPLFVAGSTAAGEEGHVLRAFRALHAKDARARLVLAPRHPEDFGPAEKAARDDGHAVTTWSRLAAGVQDTAPVPWEVMILDRMGVLPEIYAAADLVFVGGSLVPRGGQNLMEPAALGKPVLFGPLTANFRSASEALVAAGAGFVAHDGDQLGRLLVRLLTDRAGYRVASTMAARVVQANRGALQRTIRMIEEAVSPQGSQDLRAARP